MLCVVMTGLTWILALLCASGLSSASPVLRWARVVRTGQNVSLACNLTSSEEVTWFLLRSDQLLPLLTLRQSKLSGGDTVRLHTANSSRLGWSGTLEAGPVRLDIRQLEPEDAGLYFCTGRCAGDVCVPGGTHLTVNGDDGQSAADGTRRPCWSLGICLLPASLAVCLVSMVGVYLCSGKPAACCCNPVRREVGLKVTEEESLHYSSLKHPDKPRPPGRGGPRLVEEDVTYSAVASQKDPNGSHDPR